MNQKINTDVVCILAILSTGVAAYIGNIAILAGLTGFAIWCGVYSAVTAMISIAVMGRNY